MSLTSHNCVARLLAAALVLGSACAGLTAFARPAPGDVEYFGKLQAELVPHNDDMEQVEN